MYRCHTEKNSLFSGLLRLDSIKQLYVVPHIWYPKKNKSIMQEVEKNCFLITYENSRNFWTLYHILVLKKRAKHSFSKVNSYILSKHRLSKRRKRWFCSCSRFGGFKRELSNWSYSFCALIELMNFFLPSTSVHLVSLNSDEWSLFSSVLAANCSW